MSDAEHTYFLPKEFDDMVCNNCGSDHISINMFFNVWEKSWHSYDPHYWCHECNSGEYDYCSAKDWGHVYKQKWVKNKKVNIRIDTPWNTEKGLEFSHWKIKEEE